MLGGAAVDHRVAPAGAQVVAQLGHQHRSGLIGVVPHTAPAPAHIQHAPRGEYRLEHKLAVVIPPRTVAGAAHAGQGHEVKVTLRAAPGIVALVHAQQTHHLERNGTHGHQGAKGHAARAKALLRLGHLQCLQPGGTRHRDRHRLRKAGLLTDLLPSAQTVQQCSQGQAVGLRLGLHHVTEQSLAMQHPLGGRSACTGDRPPAQQSLQQVRQGPRQLGLQATHFGIRLYGVQTRQRVVHGVGTAGVTQQHALQTKPGAVLFATGVQPQGTAVLGVEAPADARARHPLREPG